MYKQWSIIRMEIYQMSESKQVSLDLGTTFAPEHLRIWNREKSWIVLLKISCRKGTKVGVQAIQGKALGSSKGLHFRNKGEHKVHIASTKYSPALNYPCCWIVNSEVSLRWWLAGNPQCLEEAKEILCGRK